MGGRSEWVAWLIVAGSCAGLFSCAIRPANPQTEGRRGMPPAPSHAASEAVHLASLDTELRGRLVSTDAVLSGNTGRIRIRVISQAIFVADTVDLAPGADEILQPLAALLSDYRETGVEVHCYTDDLDSSPAAKALTLQRAEMVSAYLANHGITSRRLRANGEGSSEPIAGNSTPESRRANRRIEIIISALSS